ncbi:GWT1-domain-containing protein [Irpex rosettiformis]|uniref:GWT1-domain-containing protein n=1 Tax=Irpex rosettiformis TaxID=378272 RepID=A0ACB8U5M0_9APHY|nr:GWT1-domain-containing protein [Irpex rosettiformis]
MEDYKTSKEAFVAGMTGSSIGHVNMVSMVALASIALHSTFRTRLPPNRTINLPVEYLLLVVPLLLSVTLFANSPGLLLLIILFPTGVLFLLPPRESGTPLPSNIGHSRPNSPTPDRATDSSNADNGSSGTPNTVPPLAALTTYRGHMLLLTCLCILAVDFPVFPRSLAKCETYGVSIMDLGVGSFVFSQGVVSAIPLIKDPNYLNAPIFPKLFATTRKCLPVLILGVIRTLSVKGTDYPEHQSEYGIHWNFFFTLGLIPIFQVFLHPLIKYLPISLLGILLAISHQIALASGGLMDYVINAPRLDIISANKEGLISLTGYFSIHLIGLSTGTILLPPSPGFFRKLQHELQNHRGPASVVNEPNSDSESDNDTPSRRRPRIRFRRENDKTATELCSYAVVWWVVLGTTLAMNIGGGVSRRVVNLPYVAWVCAFNTTFILGYLLLDLVFFPSPLSKSIYSPTSKLKVQPDPTVLGHGRRNPRGKDDTAAAAPLLEAINKNGLVFFLLGNILTGLVNLAFPTMFMSDSWAMVVLGTYAFVISASAWLTKDKKIWRV